MHALAEIGDLAQQLTPMTKRQPNFFQGLVCKIGQDGKANVILGKALRVLPEAEYVEPARNRLHWPPIVSARCRRDDHTIDAIFLLGARRQRTYRRTAEAPSRQSVACRDVAFTGCS